MTKSTVCLAGMKDNTAISINDIFHKSIQIFYKVIVVVDVLQNILTIY